MKHVDKCSLASKCKIASTDACNTHCPAFIAMHGLTGLGGRVGAASIPKDYLYVTANNSPARASQAAVYRGVDKYVATFERQFEEDGERVKSLYLYSDETGTGKTTTAVVLLKEWMVSHYIGSMKRGLEPHMAPGLFFDVNEFQTEYNLATMTNSDESMAKIQTKIAKAMHAPFLVMDDIGIRSATEAFRSYVHGIINHRNTERKPTVYTSNVPLTSNVPVSERKLAEMPYDIRDVFDKRLYDRMRDMCLELSFVGESKRGRR